MRHRHRHHVSRVDDFKFVLFLLFAVALWCCSILRGQRVAEPCERAGTCWIDHDGYLHWTAKEPRPGCPDASDAAACAKYRQSLVWQDEARQYPEKTEGNPRKPKETKPVLNRWQRFKAWWRRWN